MGSTYKEDLSLWDDRERKITPHQKELDWVEIKYPHSFFNRKWHLKEATEASEEKQSKEALEEDENWALVMEKLAHTKQLTRNSAGRASSQDSQPSC